MRPTVSAHLPLRINEKTPSTIKTSGDRSIAISWTRSPADNPYEEAEEFAAFIVRAVNAYEANEALIKELVEALEDAAKTCEAWEQESRNGGWSTHQVNANFRLANDLRRIAAKAEGRS